MSYQTTNTKSHYAGNLWKFKRIILIKSLPGIDLTITFFIVVSGGKRKKLLPNTTVSTMTKYLEIHCKVTPQVWTTAKQGFISVYMCIYLLFTLRTVFLSREVKIVYCQCLVICVWFTYTAFFSVLFIDVCIVKIMWEGNALKVFLLLLTYGMQL